MTQDPTIITSNNSTRFNFTQLHPLTAGNTIASSPHTQFAIGIPNSGQLASIPGMLPTHSTFINTLTGAELNSIHGSTSGINIPITTQLLVTQATTSTNPPIIASPVHNTITSPTQSNSILSSSPNTIPEWRQVQIQQKKQKTGSASEWRAHPTTPTIPAHSKLSNEWNQINPKTPTTPIQHTINISTPISNIQNTSSNGHIALKQSVSSPPTPTPNSATDVTGIIWNNGGAQQFVLENNFKDSNCHEWSDNSEDSPTTPNTRENNTNWTQNHNSQTNAIMPQTPTSSTENGSDPSTPTGNDAEGVWSPDIEQAFQEALAIYPPCGRRKIILSDEGKMYGRNELIARYIKLRTGKSRSRKQVSSHIQVLAKKKAREIQGKIKDPIIKDKAMANLSSMSSAQIVSASTIHNRPSVNMFAPPGIIPSHMQMSHILSNTVNPVTIKQENMPNASLIWHPQAFVQQTNHHNMTSLANLIPLTSIQGSNIQALAFPSATTIMPQGFLSPPDGNSSEPDKNNENNSNIGAAQQTLDLPLRMTDFCAFVESQSSDSDTHLKHIFVQINQGNFSNHEMESIDICHICDKFPEKNGGLKDLYEKGPQHVFFLVKFWGSLNATLLNDSSNTFYGVSSRYEGLENRTITCSTKVCSFGKQVVEKVETEYPKRENGRYVYNINRSPMCEYMLNFIQRLIHLPEKYMMNSVLENFSILQVVSDRDTQQTLLCLAYIFEVNTEEGGTRHCIYRLEQEQKES